MSEPKPDRFASSDGVYIRLHRYGGDGSRSQPGRKPVLLLHGGSGSSITFTAPDGKGLADWLYRHDLDPWLLDWRGSALVVDDHDNQQSLDLHAKSYNFNTAAEIDLPAAIARMRVHVGDDAKIALLGFCMGGGVIADAVARGLVSGKNIDRIVLMTLGLFFETPIDGRLKGEDRLLEHLARPTGPVGQRRPLSVDPRVDAKSSLLSLRSPWDPRLEGLYAAWPDALKGHDDALGDDKEERGLRAVQRMCNRMSFMYGMIYDEGNLVDTIHGTRDDAGELPTLFGGIPLQMYIHGAKNIRQGHATFFDPAQNSRNGEFVGDRARDYFGEFDRVSLIAGALDRLWHRDSLDRMHDWLCQGEVARFRRFRKHVFATYAHQDLLWGKYSAADVFPEILDGLQG